jgi:hypothetical protein
LEVKSSYVDLFGVDSSQSQDNPPTPLPQHRKRKLEERHEVDDKNESDDDDGGGGKQGDTSTVAEAEESAIVLFRVGVST